MAPSLKLEILAIDNKFITRAKKKCLNNFRYTRQEKLNELDDIAGFLIALGRLDEAIGALESVLDMANESGDDNFWVTENSRILLLYAYRLEGNVDKYKKIKKSFIEHGMEDLSQEDFAYFYSEYEYWLVAYKSETHKYRCQVLVRTIYEAIYLIEMWDFFKSNTNTYELEKLKSIVAKTTSLLLEEINSLG